VMVILLQTITAHTTKLVPPSFAWSLPKQRQPNTTTKRKNQRNKKIVKSFVSQDLLFSQLHQEKQEKYQRHYKKNNSQTKFKRNYYHSLRQLSSNNKLFTVSNAYSPSLSVTNITSPDIISPTILLQNDLYCKDYICGPLSVTYTNDALTLQRWLQHNMNTEEQFTFVGLDVESVPTFRRKQKKVDTIQIATPDSAIVLHLTSQSDIGTSTVLKDFLLNPNIIKVGVNIDCDAMELFTEEEKLIMQSRFDIGRMFRSQTVGLRNLVRAALGVELPKPKAVTISNWSKYPLTYSQVTYAARDAWASAAVVQNLFETYPKNKDKFNLDILGDQLQELEWSLPYLAMNKSVHNWAKATHHKLEQDFSDIAPPPPLPPVKELKPKEQELIQMIQSVHTSNNKQENMDTILEILKRTTRQDLPCLDCTSLEFDFSFD